MQNPGIQYISSYKSLADTRGIEMTTVSVYSGVLARCLTPESRNLHYPCPDSFPDVTVVYEWRRHIESFFRWVIRMYLIILLSPAVVVLSP
jgi:hypothetical protein